MQRKALGILWMSWILTMNIGTVSEAQVRHNRVHSQPANKKSTPKNNSKTPNRNRQASKQGKSGTQAGKDSPLLQVLEGMGRAALEDAGYRFPDRGSGQTLESDPTTEKKNQVEPNVQSRSPKGKFQKAPISNKQKRLAFKENMRQLSRN